MTAKTEGAGHRRQKSANGAAGDDRADGFDTKRAVREVAQPKKLRKNAAGIRRRRSTTRCLQYPVQPALKRSWQCPASSEIRRRPA